MFNFQCLLKKKIQARLAEIKSKLPPLPWETRALLLDKYPGLRFKEQSLDVLLNVDSGREIGLDGEGGSGAVEYFERLCKSTVGGAQVRDPGVVLNWLTHELLGQLSARKEIFRENSLSTVQFGELIDLVQNKSITGMVWPLHRSRR